MSNPPLELFRRLTNGLYVVGAAHAGQRDAFTAAWITQVSFDPLMLALSINPTHASYPILMAAGVFSVNILRRGQLELARHFGTQSGRAVDKLAGQRWQAGLGGAPVLSDVAAYLECRVVGRHAAGDHEVILGQVVGGRVLAPDATPMTYGETGNLDGSAELYPQSFQGVAMPESPRDRLIVALDLSSPAENDRLVQALGDAVSFYKIGWGVVLRPGGPELLDRLVQSGKSVFLDLKFYDVPNTVAIAVSAAAARGVRFITVHGNQEIVKAAAQARGSSPLKVLAVTVLTSISELEARRMYRLPDDVTLEDHVVRAARDFVAAGCDGLIASPAEVAAIRENVAGPAIIVTPGIRLPGESVDDQKRTGTPYDSIVKGADYLVVGRSVYRDPDPRSKVEEYVRAIAKGIEDRFDRD
jgi:orotidine 5'-phosphate decarboxylase subfamily 1